jgi:diadenosine tetraphosphate (Ap4A) HIT family hydrolase
MFDEPSCAFCALEPTRVFISDSAALATFDKYPLTDGHALVIPRRHVTSLFDLSPDEQSRIWLFVAHVRKMLADKLNVENFNVGVNDGPLAGQTILHAHIHIIPRRQGDSSDPRGGVRWVIASKADYWTVR